MAVRVGNHLRLDVARPVEKLLDEALAATEGRDGLARRRLVEVGHFVHAPRDLHAAAAATECCLDDDGQAVLLGERQHLGHVLDRPGGAGDQRRADFQRDLARLHLVAQRGDGGRWRPDPGQAGSDDGACEACVLGQEAVARMHRIGAGDLAGGEQRRNAEIAVLGGRWPDADALVGEAHMHRIGIGRGMHGNGRDAEFLAGAQHAQGDLAAVGNQDFVKHRARPSVSRYSIIISRKSNYINSVFLICISYSFINNKKFFLTFLLFYSSF
ncbi:MAG: hypothetical protein BWY69_00128 [Planctomycetes bacterium ADurb.Bin401]|nr:MAG: hypothetical protein BWY69_00128 [Planctomycetes bacterium ADurb.Bin401]